MFISPTLTTSCSFGTTSFQLSTMMFTQFGRNARPLTQLIGRVVINLVLAPLRVMNYDGLKQR